jgi:hypothetical protein
MTPNTCSTCRFFVHESGPYGQCHFQPPTTVWARVAPLDWCGQHESRQRGSKARQSPSDETTPPPVEERTHYAPTIIIPVGVAPTKKDGRRG